MAEDSWVGWAEWDRLTRMLINVLFVMKLYDDITARYARAAD